MKSTLISEGAEAKIFSVRNSSADASKILKHRTAKSYRHPDIDNSLRQFRTRREAKVIERLGKTGFPCPVLLKVDDVNMQIEMEQINGPKIRDVLQGNPKNCTKNYMGYSSEIGRLIALMHSADIIHGDLTTSNMILCSKTGQIKFIDFGLSKFSCKEEDKAVDLHLLKRALESKHHAIFNKCFEIIIKEYTKNYDGAEAVINRLEAVETRGKYKKKEKIV